MIELLQNTVERAFQTRRIGETAPAGQAQWHDIASVVSMTGIETGQLQFLVTEFGDYFDQNNGQFHPIRFSNTQIEFLEFLHRRMFLEGASVQETNRELRQASADRKNRPTHVIAVTSGKGGVGKSTTAINLAVALQHAGHSTLLADADLGMGNVHVLTGVFVSEGIGDVIQGRADLAGVAVEGPGGILMLCGGSGIDGLADISPGQLAVLESDFRNPSNPFDVVVIDTGAGISAQVQAFLRMADDVVLVTSTDMTAILDAYGVIKVAHENKIDAPVHIVVNQVTHEKESETVFHRLENCSQLYLGRPLHLLGAVRNDRHIRQANKDREVIALKRPRAAAVKAYERLATNLRTAFVRRGQVREESSPLIPLLERVRRES